jgi:uncharacterized protein (TIGR03067 family)
MLDGTWIPQAAQFGGEAIPLPDARFVISGDRYIIETGGTREEGRLAIDASVAPSRVDLLGTTGPHAGQAIAAIFRLRGNLLQLCYLVGERERSGARPRTLDSPRGSLQLLIRYRRED